MDRADLIERLKGYEWNDVEFKEAQWAAPKSAYETVSAFSNTAGGWLVFGVKEKSGKFEILGVTDVDKVQNEFLNTIRSEKKVSAFIPVEESMVKEGDATVLIFFIPEAHREKKPIHLNGNMLKSYIRRGASDQHCTEEEIRRFVRDASAKTHDSDQINIDCENCFDKDAIQWYRDAWQRRNPGKMEASSDLEFLQHFGLIEELDHKMWPIRAALLLFGTEKTILQIMPRPVVDFRRVAASFDEAPPDQRWHDRDLLECNLIIAWRRIFELYQKEANVPFKLDAATLEREDKPVDYTAFREALINLLTHQDFGDHSRKSSILMFRDRMVFWNPGAAFVSREEMFQPGEHSMRNPRIAGMFRRIGLGEQAGSGIGAIYSNWRSLGRVSPIIENNKAGHHFCLTLLGEELVSEDQVLFQARLGVHLSEEEAAVFAQAYRGGQIWPLEAKAITGLSGAKTEALLNRLTVQQLIEPKPGQGQTHYVLAEHLREALTFATKLKNGKMVEIDNSLVSDHAEGKQASLVSDPVKPLKEISETQWKIIQFSDSPHQIGLIMKHLGVTNRTFFRRTHLNPLLTGGILKMTYPDNPKHPRQAYVLTETGFDLRERFRKKGKGKVP